MTQILTMGRDQLSKTDAIHVARIEAAPSARATAGERNNRFTDMVRNAGENALAAWFAEAEDSMLPSLVRGLLSD
ncbi:hypothetical protein [Pseudooceanicola sp.]|uniref:hypothetical protein n=1 Tax=Pseudooceanicola sp. TaxID=1914328 RepID=UPI003518BD7C